MALIFRIGRQSIGEAFAILLITAEDLKGMMLKRVVFNKYQLDSRVLLAYILLFEKLDFISKKY